MSLSWRPRHGTAGAVLAAALLVLGCGREAGNPPTPTAAELAAEPWDSVLARARGTIVIWRMWRGDPAINAYVDGWVAPRMRESFGIDVRAVDAQGPELVNALVTEREATGERDGTASLL